MIHPVMVLLSLMLPALLVAPPACGATLEQEAANLRAKALHNLALLSTITMDQQVTVAAVSAGGQPVGQARESHEAISWSRSTARLRQRHLSSPASGYAVDVLAHRLLLARGATTLLDESADDIRLAGLATPQPAWLWRPEWLIPEHPAAVRIEGIALVITAGTSYPRREIWLDRSLGLVQKVVETDATGRVVRVATCSDWRRVGAAWVSFRVEDTVTGTVGGVRRVWALGACAVNAPLTEADFALP